MDKNCAGLNKDEIENLSSFIAEVNMYRAGHGQDSLIMDDAMRYLRAARFNASKAIDIYKNYQKYREAYNLESMRTYREPLSSEIGSGKLQILGTQDSEGAPLLLFTASRHDKSSEHRAAMQLLFHTLDQVTESAENGVVFLIDVRECSLSSFDKKYMNNMLSVLQDGYPLYFKTIYIISAPIWLKTQVTVMKTFKQQNKVKFISFSDLPQLFAPDQLPLSLGGSSSQVTRPSVSSPKHVPRRTPAKKLAKQSSEPSIRDPANGDAGDDHHLAVNDLVGRFEHRTKPGAAIDHRPLLHHSKPSWPEQKASAPQNRPIKPPPPSRALRPPNIQAALKPKAAMDHVSDPPERQLRPAGGFKRQTSFGKTDSPFQASPLKQAADASSKAAPKHPLVPPAIVKSRPFPTATTGATKSTAPTTGAAPMKTNPHPPVPVPRSGSGSSPGMAALRSRVAAKVHNFEQHTSSGDVGQRGTRLPSSEDKFSVSERVVAKGASSAHNKFSPSWTEKKDPPPERLPISAVEKFKKPLVPVKLLNRGQDVSAKPEAQPRKKECLSPTADDLAYEIVEFHPPSPVRNVPPKNPAGNDVMQKPHPSKAKTERYENVTGTDVVQKPHPSKTKAECYENVTGNDVVQKPHPSKTKAECYENVALHLPSQPQKQPDPTPIIPVHYTPQPQKQPDPTRIIPVHYTPQPQKQPDPSPKRRNYENINIGMNLMEEDSSDEEVLLADVEEFAGPPEEVIYENFGPDEGDRSMIPEELEKYITKIGKCGLAAEYLKIKNEPLVGLYRACKLPYNLGKNRYKDVVCYDDTRVGLRQISRVEGSDYIHANYVDGYSRPAAFILTQGPTKKTVGDFWRLLWEYQVYVIVMTTKCVELGKHKCAQYWPEDGSSMTYSGITINVSKTQNYDSYDVRTFKVQSKGVERTILHFQFLAWPDYGVPDSGMAVVKLVMAVREVQSQYVRDTKNMSPNGPPIVVHCSAGVGRSGTFCALDYCIDELHDQKRVNVQRAVRKLRMQRAFAIQTDEQYAFCYRTVLEYAKSHKYAIKK